MSALAAPRAKRTNVTLRPSQRWETLHKTTLAPCRAIRGGTRANFAGNRANFGSNGTDFNGTNFNGVPGLGFDFPHLAAVNGNRHGHGGRFDGAPFGFGGFLLDSPGFIEVPSGDSGVEGV